jgi:hypothetical protein
MPACVLNAVLLTLSMRRGEFACLHALGCQSPVQSDNTAPPRP